MTYLYGIVLVMVSEHDEVSIKYPTTEIELDCPDMKKPLWIKDDLIITPITPITINNLADSTKTLSSRGFVNATCVETQETVTLDKAITSYTQHFIFNKILEQS